MEQHEQHLIPSDNGQSNLNSFFGPATRTGCQALIAEEHNKDKYGRTIPGMKAMLCKAGSATVAPYNIKILETRREGIKVIFTSRQGIVETSKSMLDVL